MPKYTPTIHYCGKGEYKEAIGAISVIFENHPSPHNVAELRQISAVDGTYGKL